MNVYYDFEVDEEYADLAQSPESKAISDELRRFVIEKLTPMESEINQNEEMFSLQNNGKIAYIRLTMMKEPYNLHCYGYKDDVELKIVKTLQPLGQELESRLFRAKAILYN